MNPIVGKSFTVKMDYCENGRLAGLYVYSQHQYFSALRRPLNQHSLLRTPHMKQMMILGIANTGLAVIKQKPVGYSLIAAETIKTRPRDETGKRLALIDDVINATLDAWNITGIAIERVFYNYNVTSSLTTGAVIGILQFIAHQRGVPIH